jgi:5,5'-dehydrodivanillate O-demethylase oxygenase subunit
MLTQAQNERLTRVGPGTPGGALLRRYWQPICPSGEITAENPKKRLRILGEDLLVYRDDAGALVCIEEQCAHRRASLFYGFIEPGGIRCCYHGWKYDNTGRCIERPFEPREAANKICLKTYPLQLLGDVVFVYMGPQPAPLLPRWDVLVRNDGHRAVVVLPIHECNWLQIQENAADSVHTYYVHGHNSAVRNLPTLPISGYYYRPITSYDWSVSEWGIERTIAYGGDRPEIEIRPPLIFPNIVRIPEGPVEALHFRVPIDDTHTRIFWVGLRPAKAGSTDGATESFQYAESLPLTYTDEDLATFYGQDRVVCETQGDILDRTKELLGTTDRGIGMFRRMLPEQIDRVERGEAPTVGVVRDEAQNEMITFVSASRTYTDDERHVFAVAN